MSSFSTSEFNETIKRLQQSIEQLKAENSELRTQLEAGFEEAVRKFSESLHESLDGGFSVSQYSSTQPMGLGPR
jgi:phage shock protein A